MPRIPEETIQQIIAATDIVELVGRYVKLKRAGSNYSGLCPFHTEKTPSFSVSPSRNSYHCFGCGAGGSAIRFLQEHDGLTFPEAVKRLAEAAGIRIEEEVWDANAEREARQRSLLKQLHKDLAEYLHALLLRHEMADAARQYLKARGINSAIAKNWQLGYAPDHGSVLRRWAAEKKYPEHLLIEGGVFKQADDGRSYPYFRHRLMFPIRNENGEVIAFSGRLLDAEAKAAKYLNSPETPIFSKSKVFFGFDKSKRAIAKAGQAVVCEGQIDMLMVYEAGFQNVVASQGTAFTEYHARLLKRHCDEVVLCFDSDNAGYKAAEKSFHILSPVGLVVKVAKLPKGEDPDSLIRKQGPEEFARLISSAAEFLDFQISHKMATQGTDLRNQVQLIEQTAATIAMNPSVAGRDLSIRSHAGQLGLSEDALRREVNVFVKRQQNSKPGPAAAPTTLDEGRKLLNAQHKTARMLCRLALSEPEVLDWLRESDIGPLLKELPGTEMLGRVWRASFEAGDEAAQTAFFATLPAEEEAAFAQLLAQPMPRGGLEAAREALNSLDLARLLHLKQQAQLKLKQPELSAEDAARLQQQVIAFNKEYLDRTRGTSDNL
jgi:DNA primase